MKSLLTRFNIAAFLFLGGLSAALAYDASVRKVDIRKPATVENPSQLPTMLPQATSENKPVIVSTSPVLLPPRSGKNPYSVQNGLPGVNVGYTYYDFQTNACMAERLGYLEDGGERYLQVLWMAAKDSTRGNRQPGFNDSRGSHYNFVDVTDPENPTATLSDWSKVELPNERAGWPSLVQFEDGVVGTPSHNAVFNGTVTKFFVNSGPGDDRFFQQSEVSVPADEALWPRAAVDGEGNVHLIYNRTLPDQSSQLAYRRSTNQGETWEPEIMFTGPSGILPVGQTGTLPGGAGGDTYAITARGPLVVVVYLDGPLRVLTRISTDYGRTWDGQNSLGLLWDAQYNWIDSTEYNNDGIPSITVYSDTIVSPSNQLAVIIDSEGIPHYIMGQTLTYIIQKGLKDNSVSGARRGTIYSVSDDAMYKDLGMFSLRYGDSLMYSMAPAGGGEWDGVGKIVSRRAYTGSSRYPQLGIDDNDNIYMAYCSMKSGDLMPMQIDTTGATADQPDSLVEVDGLFSHVYVTHKPKGVNIWSKPVDITPDGKNCLFSTVCDVVTDQMYIAYSANDMPGDRVTSLELPTMQTDIYVYPFPISSLNTVNSVSEFNTLDVECTVAPNPASNAARVQISGIHAGMLRATLISIQGEEVWSGTVQSAGTSLEFSVPVNHVGSGIYKLVMEQDGKFANQTLSVIK